jgi:hypothetical protein
MEIYAIPTMDVVLWDKRAPRKAKQNIYRTVITMLLYGWEVW